MANTSLVKYYGDSIDLANTSPSKPATKSIPDYTGYLPVGIIRCAATGSYNATLNIYELSINANNHTISFKNTTTFESSSQAGIEYTIVYVKHSLR